MSEIYFIGDLHFGHRNIHKFRSELNLESEGAHREFLIDNWNKQVNKRDVVWILGDAVFGVEYLPDLDRMKGQKFLVMGNHDIHYEHYYGYVRRIEGLRKYKGFWLSHAPIHPVELRGKPNIHGHVHSQTLPDTKNYFNASCENINYTPVHIDEVKRRMSL